LAGSLPTG